MKYPASKKTLLTSRDVLEFATIEGAKANHLDHKVGSISPGKCADLLILSIDSYSVMAVNDPVGCVVSSMGPQNIDTVMIDGRIVKQNGELKGFNKSTIRQLIHDAQYRNYKAANL